MTQWQDGSTPSRPRAGFRTVSVGSTPSLRMTDLQTGTGEFTPRAGPASHSGYLISWEARPTSGDDAPPPVVLASLGDAHQPAMFGDVAATLRGKICSSL